MKAQILAINRHNRCAAARTADGITVFEIVGNIHLMEGDIISGNLESTGRAACFYNESQHVDLDVEVRASHCSEEGAVRLLFD
ncbi:MAG: hypothetical protein QM808_16590 [Steroidobacteraceae bacterium]